MPITIIRGPAGGGKSQAIADRLQPGEVVIDFTRLYVALAGVERGPDGKFPVREDGDPRLALTEYVRLTAIRQAAERELSGYVTTSDGRPEAVERLQAAGATGGVETIDPGEAVVRARLADPVSGEVSDPCRKAGRPLVRRRRSGAAGRSRRRPAGDGGDCGGPGGGETVIEYRYAAVECRVDDERRGPGRLVGTLLRYGEVSPERRERFAPGALRWPAGGVVLREMHTRAAPILRVEPELRGAELVIDAVLPDTARGRDAATSIRNGTLRGLSVEFRAERDRYLADGVRLVESAVLVGWRAGG